jgi:meso-butanediol dehydrogenase / (S,S)-butanediol dehydrogenase / diacetyl reductase
MCRAALPEMRERRAGKIINIGSDSAKTGDRLLAHYCASKFGVLGFTQALALELAPFHVHANCVCPTWCETDMMRSLAETFGELQHATATEMMAEWSATNPWGRMAHPADVGLMCVYLASDYADYVTG